jgi:hypothetical protein
VRELTLWVLGGVLWCTVQPHRLFAASCGRSFVQLLGRMWRRGQQRVRALEVRVRSRVAGCTLFVPKLLGAHRDTRRGDVQL